MWNALLKAGVYVNIALPPGTPNKLCLLRCSVSAAHTEDEIDRIIELFGAVVAQGHGKKAVNALSRARHLVKDSRVTQCSPGSAK